MILSSRAAARRSSITSARDQALDFKAQSVSWPTAQRRLIDKSTQGGGIASCLYLASDKHASGAHSSRVIEKKSSDDTEGASPSTRG